MSEEEEEDGEETETNKCNVRKLWCCAAAEIQMFKSRWDEMRWNGEPT